VIRVLLADDQEIVRQGFRTILERGGDVEIVGEVGTGADAVAAARRERPDVVVMDVRMPVLDGIAATQAVTADPALAAVHVLVITSFDLDDHVFGALRAGAAGFLTKDADADELRRAVRVVAAGESLLAPEATRRLIERFLARPRADAATLDRIATLTDREREAVRLAASGLSNERIGDELFISTATARTHIGRAMQKLDARDRAQLVIAAYEGGLVDGG
jgi:DNA-binding NarL/FixJ family response regulator